MAENKERTRISVEINNQTYTIVGTETKEHVEHVATLVNGKMDDIHQANKHLDMTKLSVLTAINTMNDYVKLKEDHEKLKADNNKLKKTNQKLTDDNNTLKETNNTLKTDYDKLKEDYEDLETLIEEEH